MSPSEVVSALPRLHKVLAQAGVASRRAAEEMIAEAIAGRNLTVCALNLRVAEILASSPDMRVMVPGGFVRPGELSFTGPSAERPLSDYRFDTYVLTVSAIDFTTAPVRGSNPLFFSSTALCSSILRAVSRSPSTSATAFCVG